MKRLVQWFRYKMFEREMMQVYEDAPERIAGAFMAIWKLTDEWPSLPEETKLARMAAPSIHAHMTNNSDWGLEQTTEYYHKMIKQINPTVAISLTEAARIIYFERDMARRQKLKAQFEKGQRAWYRRLWIKICTAVNQQKKGNT